MTTSKKTARNDLVNAFTAVFGSTLREGQRISRISSADMEKRFRKAGINEDVFLANFGIDLLSTLEEQGFGACVLMLLELERTRPLGDPRTQNTEQTKTPTKKNTKKNTTKNNKGTEGNRKSNHQNTSKKTGKTNVRQRILEMIMAGTFTGEQIKNAMAIEFPDAKPTYVPTLLYRARQTGTNSMYGQAAQIDPETGIYSFPK